MIIDVDYIRHNVRDIAANIDADRLRNFIREAENIDIRPVIGVDVWRRLSEYGPVQIDNEGTLLLDEKGHPILVNTTYAVSDEEAKLLLGGYYTSDCGCEEYFEGLLLALGYFAYARLVREQSLNVTAYGVVIKEGELSSPADTRAIAAAALNAQNIAEAYLGNTLKYWRTVQNKGCCGEAQMPKRMRKFIPIGH